MLDGGNRHHGLIVQRVHGQLDVHELGGKQLVVFIAEQGAQLHRTGGGIHHRIHGRQGAGGDLVGLAAVIDIHRQGGAAVHPRHHLADTVFGNGEQHRHGLQLGDHDDAAGLAGRDQIAHIHQMDAGTARHRRDDIGVSQIDAGGFHIRLVGDQNAFRGFHQRGLVGHLLLRDGVLRQQRLIARQVHLGIGQGGAVARQLAANLIQRRLIGARIDLRQGITLLDHLAFGEIQLDQHAADLRPHRRGGERRHRAQRIERHIDVAGDRAGHAHRLCPLVDQATAAGLLGRIDCPDQQGEQRQSHGKPHHPRQPGIARTPALDAGPGTAQRPRPGRLGKLKIPGRAVDIHWSIRVTKGPQSPKKLSK